MPVINYSDKGFSILHRFSLVLIISLWFWMVLLLWGVLDLSLINLPFNYHLSAVIGLLFSAFGSLQNYGEFYSRTAYKRIRSAFLKTNFQLSIMAFCVFAAYFVIKDAHTSRFFLITYILSCWPVLVLSNFALPGVFKRLNGYYGMKRNAVLVGSPSQLNQLASWLNSQENKGFVYIGAFLTDHGKLNLPGIRNLGFYTDLDSYLSYNNTYQIVVLPDETDGERLMSVADLATKYGCRFLLYNNLSGLFDDRLAFMEESGRQFLTLLNEPLQSPFNRMIKRVLDLSICIPSLLLLFPFAMLVVKIFQILQSPGPLFFKQERVGMAGKRFVIWKFRSMHFEEKSEEDEAVQAQTGDNRVFAFGKIMRRFSIDELPQFINVLMGDMSLVGPRPYLKAHDHLFQKSYKSYRIRQFVKPGVTGPAQCRGLRGEFTDDALVSKRIELDFAYVGSWSIWTDMIIILRTVGQVLFPPKSAY